IVQKLIGVELAVLEKAAQEEPKKKALKKIKPSMFSYKASTDIKIVKTENVLGLLEGTDKKDELLVISAHFDHVGVSNGGEGDVIYNGADDDGSGTVAVMQLAKVFAEAKKAGHGPRRSILFMAFTGEESGLLGSDFYAKHPTFPLQNTVANLNIDMIGRRDAKHAESPPYVYVIGADKLSSTLNSVSETANKNFTNLVFDYTYNDLAHPDNLYYRSDHWNFAKRNIPIIFYFDGIHEDYHQPGDEVEKIEFDLLAKRTQCIFYTAWEIVNRDVRIALDKN
ncbi:MAG TPA: M28 family peptidase, partial [Chryseolinea sp.]